MTTVRGARPSSVYTEFEELDFAKDALLRVSILAADVGAQQKSCVAGCLAAKLLIARRALETADATELPRIQRRLPKLLVDLERVCAWPREPEPYQPILRSVLRKDTFRSLQAVETRIQNGVLAFSKGPDFVRVQYFKMLDHFSRTTTVARDGRTAENASSFKRRKAAYVADDYPAHVNASLYAVLRDHSSCTCAAVDGFLTVQRHPGRLRLRADILREDDGVAFDMLFSASPRADDYWQDLKVTVVMQKVGKKSVRYVGSGNAAAKARRGISIAKSRLLSPAPGSLCALVRPRPGARICCWVRDLELQQLHDASPIAQHATSGPSLSLRSILETHRLSNRMKLVLGYIISRSFWQYYDSPWMNIRWSSDTIHFFSEMRPYLNEAGDWNMDVKDTALYASRPYYVVDFDDDTGRFLEYCDEYSVIFRYPRLLALSMMLLEIGRGECLSIGTTTIGAGLNKNWDLAQQLLARPKAWGDFDYPDFRHAISNCLDRTLFEDAGRDADDDLAVTNRKAALHEYVVLPLERLLKNLGYWDELYDVGPIESQGPPYAAASSIPVSPSLPLPSEAILANAEMTQSSEWLSKITSINGNIHSLSSLSKRRRLRVAILDTGYDAEAVFFGIQARRQRLKGWMDYVDDSEHPVDSNGHGTHTVSVLMKVAPLADVYVARIARDRACLGTATDSIRRAIYWAAVDCEADIISMSFGFREEIPLIRTAIYEAAILRNDRVLFLAAASNYGGNSRELFPASHDAVISIRATNAHGAFLDTNPPADPYGPVVYGTLGKDVPAAWLSAVNGELSKSGSSVATAIAAGIAAMMLGVANTGFESEQFRMPQQVEGLWTKKGMESLFRKMAQDMGGRCFYISPGRFFDEKDIARVWAAMVDACN